MAHDRYMHDPLCPGASFCLKLRFEFLLDLNFKNLRCDFNCLLIPVSDVETLLQVNLMGVDRFFLTCPILQFHSI
jgi:hypothetical protein